jgi:hypothetical protein
MKSPLHRTGLPQFDQENFNKGLSDGFRVAGTGDRALVLHGGLSGSRVRNHKGLSQTQAPSLGGDSSRPSSCEVSRKGGHRQQYDFEVYDDDGVVGRIYRVNANEGLWFWGISFNLADRKNYGHADSFDAAKAAFQARYRAWRPTLR